MDPILALAGFGVGTVVGLTGMGGGELMTPILVLVFGVPPVAAVSSDLAASAVMKPFGGWVHLRRGTVNWPLVGWLCLGSVPSAFLGVLLLRLLAPGPGMQQLIQRALAVALLLAAAGLVAKSWAARRGGAADERPVDRAAPQVHEAAERLHHRARGEVAGDGGDRRNTEDQDQDRGHQRPATHAGEPHHDADTEARERHDRVHPPSLLFPLT